MRAVAARRPAVFCSADVGKDTPLGEMVRGFYLREHENYCWEKCYPKDNELPAFADLVAVVRAGVAAPDGGLAPGAPKVTVAIINLGPAPNVDEFRDALAAAQARYTPRPAVEEAFEAWYLAKLQRSGGAGGALAPRAPQHGERRVRVPCPAGVHVKEVLSSSVVLPLGSEVELPPEDGGGTGDLTFAAGGSVQRVLCAGKSFWPFVCNGDHVTPVPGGVTVETTRPTWQPRVLKSVAVADGLQLSLSGEPQLAIADGSHAHMGLSAGDVIISVQFESGANLDVARVAAMTSSDFAMATAGKGTYTLTVLSASGVVSNLPFLDWQYNAREKEIFASSFAQE